jgi:thiosulfate/3-mercaptopyruvate sulfurtransferase
MTTIVTDTVNTYFKTLISACELQSLLQSGVATLIDCRFDLANPRAGLEAYRAAHIPGARYADLNQDLSGPSTLRSGRHPLPDPGDLAARFAAWGADAAAQIVVYDAANGSFAARAWWLARWLGMANVAVLDGGMEAWIAAGGTVETRIGATRIDAASVDRANIAHAIDAAPATHLGATHLGAAHTADRAAWSSSDEVLAALRDPTRLLVDARAAERFTGQAEPLDPVAGHVAGAVNFPLAGNLNANGRFLPREVLRDRWLARLGTTRAQDAIMMCGSGVTACHNLLAIEHAGLGTAKLYAGSWSEWIKDPARPIARG